MLNKVTLIGNVGADPEIRTLENGIKVARIGLATTERIYNRTTKETKEHTEWHNITLWRGLADVADRYIKKGSQIYIEGNIRSREWSDDNGAKRSAIEIVAYDMKMLGRREGGSANTSYSNNATQSQPISNPAPTPQSQTPAAPIMMADDTDDLPF